MKPRQGMTETEYARHLGIAQSNVNRAKRAGRIALFPDGSIDPERSDELYFRETDLEQSERGRMRGPRSDGISNAALMRAKALQLVASGNLAREKLARLRGEVVDREEAQRIVFALARRERDSWLQWPARIAAAVAAELGPEGNPLSIHAVQVCLEKHVADHLMSLPTPNPEPFPFRPRDAHEDKESEEDFSH